MKKFFKKVVDAIIEARMDAAKVRLQQNQGFWY